MSLQTMLVGETVGEIVQASKFAIEIFSDDPRTPDVKISTESTSRRKREKIEKNVQLKESPRRRTRPRIIFKPSPPKKTCNKEDEIERRKDRYSASKVAKNPVLFPNQLFVADDSNQQRKFYKTRSPVIARAKQQTPNKFLIKSPRQVSKFQVKVRSPTKIACLSPPKNRGFGKKVDSLIVSSRIGATMISPSKNLGRNRDGLMKMVQSPSVVSKLRRSLSPARIAARFISPLRNLQRNGDASLKRRHIVVTPKKFYPLA